MVMREFGRRKALKVVLAEATVYRIVAVPNSCQHEPITFVHGII